MTISARRVMSGAAASMLLALLVFAPARAAQEQKICDPAFRGCFKVRGKAPYSPANPFIAGVHPGSRPEKAPVIVGFEKPAEWYGQALHGISEPYPYSLKFLEDQGPWFSPFIHPGMTGRYDIRHWHKAKTARVQKAAAAKPRSRRRTRRARRKHRRRSRHR